MALDPLNLVPPTVDPAKDKWGSDLNTILRKFQDSFNALLEVVVNIGASGVVFYDPATGWATPSAGQKVVFSSVGYSAAPPPTGGAVGSAWMGSNA